MKKPTRLQFEALESRQAMTADITAVLAGGVLSITGDHSGSSITIDRTATQIRVLETDQSFQVNKVKSIAVQLGSSDDKVHLDGLVSKSPWNGPAVTITTGGGADKLTFKGGNTYYFGGDLETVIVDTKGAVKIAGMKPDWFDMNVPTTEAGMLARQLATDKVLDRNDMIELFEKAEELTTLGHDNYVGLRAVVNNKAFYKGVEWVQGLSSYVVNPTVANGVYQEQPLGNLSALSTDDQLENLVDKWFYGLDHPTVGVSGVDYMPVSGQLFDGPPTYTQVHQGSEVGDCYFLSAMNAIDAHNPAVIENMFVARNDDGTYVLRFYNNKTPYYVTIDSMLPVYTATNKLWADDEELLYNDPANILWSAFAEKAYAQLAEFGWTQTTGTANAYASISSGYANYVMAQITGKPAEYLNIEQDKVTEKEVVKAWQKDRPVSFGTKGITGNSLIVHDHDYALVDYDSTTKQFLVANPWGDAHQAHPATLWLTWAQIKTSMRDVHMGSPV